MDVRNRGKLPEMRYAMSPHVVSIALEDHHEDDQTALKDGNRMRDIGSRETAEGNFE